MTDSSITNLDQQNANKISVGEILNQTFSFFCKNLIWMIFFGVICALPYFVGFAYLYLSEGSIQKFNYPYLRFFRAVPLLLFTWAMIFACRSGYNKTEISWKNAIYETITQIHKILGATLLSILATAFGLIFLIVPGFMIAMSFCCVLPILLIENSPILNSFRRSAKLTKGNRWRIFWLFSILYFIYFVVGVPVTMLLKYTLSIPLEDAAQLVDTLTGPFVCFMIGIVSTLLYYNLCEKYEFISMYRKLSFDK